MWFSLDIILLACTIATGKPYRLILSYTIGSLIVLIVHCNRGKWMWTHIETLSAVGVAVTAVLWQTLSPELGVIAGVSAMTIAGIPMTIHLWEHPDRGAFWMFTNTLIACTLTLIGTWPWSIGGSLLPGGVIFFNGLLAWIVLRDNRIAVTYRKI